MYPDFLGIGAQKAGTTWLSRNLQLHPEVWVPSIKEIHYFDEKIHEPANPLSRTFEKVAGKRDRDRRWRRQVKRRSIRHLKGFSKQDILWDLRYYVGRPDDAWYASLFEPGEGKMTGEITPAYSMLDRDEISHVHALMPHAKIVFFVRNPVERAWSQAVMHFSRSEGHDIERVPVERLRRHFDREGSRSRTNYLRTLENWAAFYPEDQIFVGFLEDVYFLPIELLRSVFGFLGVDPSFEPPGADERVHSRTANKVPTEHVIYLARAYREELTRIAERFGGYASFWSYCAERLTDSRPSEDEVVFPFWQSPMWEEWAGRRPRRLRSGPLSSLRAENW